MIGKYIISLQGLGTVIVTNMKEINEFLTEYLLSQLAIKFSHCSSFSSSTLHPLSSSSFYLPTIRIHGTEEKHITIK
jgi:hypothetical protein